MKNNPFSAMPLLLAFLHVFVPLKAQEVTIQKDTSFSFKLGFFDFSMIFDDDTLAYEKKVPAITIAGGFTKLFYHSDVFEGQLADLNSYEIILSSMAISRTPQNADVIKYSHNGLFLKTALSSWQSLKDATKGIRTDTWTFGLSSGKGFGYKLGKYSYLIFHQTSGINWNKITFLDTADNDKDKDAIDVFGSAIRFGEYFDGGIKYRFLKNLSLNIDYERSLIYPRHLFWKWTWSKIIESTGSLLIDFFINEIHESTPSATPIVYFILKNAYSYGFYELYNSRMNWPSETVPPLMFNTFKIGISMYF